MKLERLLFILDGYSNSEEVHNIYITEQKYEKGQYVKWTPELQEACDKQQPIKAEKMKNIDFGFCGKCTCTIGLNTNYCPLCGHKVEW